MPPQWGIAAPPRRDYLRHPEIADDPIFGSLALLAILLIPGSVLAQERVYDWRRGMHDVGHGGLGMMLLFWAILEPVREGEGPSAELIDLTRRFWGQRGVHGAAPRWAAW